MLDIHKKELKSPTWQNCPLFSAAPDTLEAIKMDRERMYVLITGLDYESDRILGVYSSKELAEKASKDFENSSDAMGFDYILIVSCEMDAEPSFAKEEGFRRLWRRYDDNVG